MELYLREGRVSKTHPDVRALSDMLRLGRRGSAVKVASSFRNPAGVAFRLRNFGRLDPDAPPGRDAGIKPGGEVDRLVWEEFGTELEALVAEAERIRGEWASNMMRVAAERRSSRGPMPSPGARTFVVHDGECAVYLAALSGPVHNLLYDRPLPDGFSLLKIGRSNDLVRRIRELSFGIPPSSNLWYRPLAFRSFASVAEAHRIERSLLDLCDLNAWSLGGEFAVAPADLLTRRLHAA